MDEQQLHALVTGRVQGVSFRYYTTRAARQFDLTGWVAVSAGSTGDIFTPGTSRRQRYRCRN
jgi:acylphosphatase